MEIRIKNDDYKVFGILMDHIYNAIEEDDGYRIGSTCYVLNKEDVEIIGYDKCKKCRFNSSDCSRRGYCPKNDYCDWRAVEVEKNCKTCKYDSNFCLEAGSCGDRFGYPDWKANTNQQERHTDTAEEATHYHIADMQPIEIMQKYLSKEEFVGAMKMNVIKYVLRIVHKDNTRADAGKCMQYAKWMCDAMDGKTIVPGGKS
jgi:hypothetical protein